MRTTLDLDDDVLMAVKEIARRKQMTIGKAASELIREAINAPQAALFAKAPPAVYGVRPFPKRGGIITNELINKLRDDDIY